jgi:hypothetical protein
VIITREFFTFAPVVRAVVQIAEARLTDHLARGPDSDGGAATCRVVGRGPEHLVAVVVATAAVFIGVVEPLSVAEHIIDRSVTVVVKAVAFVLGKLADAELIAIAESRAATGDRANRPFDIDLTGRLDCARNVETRWGPDTRARSAARDTLARTCSTLNVRAGVSVGALGPEDTDVGAVTAADQRIPRLVCRVRDLDTEGAWRGRFTIRRNAAGLTEI